MEKYKRLIGIEQQPLSDQEYLDQYILSMYRFRSHELWGIKDSSSTFLAAPESLSMLFGLTSKEMVGKKDGDIPCKTAECAEDFYAQDKKVQITKDQRQILDVLEFNTGLQPLRTAKAAIINPATNNTLGVIFHCDKLVIDETLGAILDVHGRLYGLHPSMSMISSVEEFGLSSIEFEVLFCICLGIKDQQAIARFLSFIYKQDIQSDTIVCEVLKSLYHKLACSTITELMDFAVANNLHLQIPVLFATTTILNI